MFVKDVFYVSVVVFMTIGGCRQGSQSSSSALAPLQTGKLSTSGSDNSETGADQDTASSDLKVLVYYFHPTFRCAACTFAESLAHQVIEEHWTDAVDQGLLQWTPVNFELAENQSLAKLFEIDASAVVIVSIHHGQDAEWKMIGQVWKQVEQPQAFQDLVDNQILEFLKRK